MKKIVLKVINLMALLGAVIWLARAPDWEPAITSLVLLGSLIGQEAWSYLNHSEKDKELLQTFLKLFPSNGSSACFLKEQDIGDPFYKEDLKELDEFLRTWTNAEYEFQNKNLEAQKKKLLELAQSFRSELSGNISSDVPGFLTMGIKDYEDRENKLKIRDKLNRMATEVYDAHQDLIRLGRKYT